MALLFSSTVESPEVWREAFAQAMPEKAFRVWPADVGDAAEIEVALVWRHEPGTLRGFPNLKVIYNLGAGMDHLLSDSALPEGVPLVRLVDPALTRDMTAFVVARVLWFHRELHRYQDLQRQGRWEELAYIETGARRIGVLGLGVLGGDAAGKLAGLGFPVAGWSRTAKDIDGVRCFHGQDGLAPFLARSDIVVCLLPLTATTKGILNRETFAALPRGAYVINAARGGHLVEDDLIEALDKGHIAGAGLDVFAEEPLPRGHPFWSHPRIWITPHVASLTSPRSAAATVAANLSRFFAGEPLRDVVDPAKGY